MSGYVVGPLLCVLLADRLGRRRSIVLFGDARGDLRRHLPVHDGAGRCHRRRLRPGRHGRVVPDHGLGSVPEFFPTAFRFRGGGFTQTVGRIFLIVSPFIVLSLFTSFGIVGVILVVSGCLSR